ncbi:MAG: hypothetical protein KatS3mg131_1796 [Candidatus Tectimicrobiota bacterium]|nr:MAG: hypothetical protein KatS3mg131_1796 [Candidatus Tectomicrobia bacterium]
MKFWSRWWTRSGQLETTVAPQERRVMLAGRHEEARLRAELRQLLQQRQAVERRGCFSDRELAEKDLELERLDRRIKALKIQQFRLRTQGKR